MLIQIFKRMLPARWVRRAEVFLVDRGFPVRKKLGVRGIEQLGAQMPPPGAFLSPSQIEAVAAYVEAEIKGRGPITRAECNAYFGSAPQTCQPYE